MLKEVTDNTAEKVTDNTFSASIPKITLEIIKLKQLANIARKIKKANSTKKRKRKLNEQIYAVHFF